MDDLMRTLGDSNPAVLALVFFVLMVALVVALMPFIGGKKILREALKLPEPDDESVEEQDHEDALQENSEDEHAE